VNTRERMLIEHGPMKLILFTAGLNKQ
jgi:hypothetical protein